MGDPVRKLGEISEGNHACARPVIAGVELRIGKATAEGECVFAAGPNGVGGGHPAILKDAGEGALRSRGRSDVQSGIERRTASRWVLV